MYQQVYDPVMQSLLLTSIFAALPLITMFVLLGGLKWSPHLSGFCSLIVAIAVAVGVYGMPLTVALNVSVYGAAFSVLPIILIIVHAIWIQNMMVKSGFFEVLRRSFGVLSEDLRIQSIIIAFCFGGLLEALAGAGTPIVVAATMLVALGMDPFKAAICALAADTAPVAFGALAVPITTLAAVTGLPFETLGAITGRQTPVIAAFIPLLLVYLVDGRRGLSQIWPAALISGVAFSVAQFVCSNYISVQLSDVVASLAGAGALIAFLHAWQPREIVPISAPDIEMAVPKSVGAAAVGDFDLAPKPQKSVFIAFLPYITIITIFTLAQFSAVQNLLNVALIKFNWPDLAILSGAGKPVGTSLALPLLSGTAPLLLIAGLLCFPFLGLTAREAGRTYVDTVRQLRLAFPTVLSVLAVAFVMNLSGQTITLGKWMAGTGHVFAFLSGAIGWLGVAITGSDNSANALFGAMQVAAAHETGLPAALLAAANGSGGVVAKMISPQSLVIGAAAVGLIGREGDIFRKCLPWSLLLMLALCLLVYLQSTPVLSWMLP